MNKAYRDYKSNGWIIVASEYYNDWDLTPRFELNDDYDLRIDYFRGKEDIRFQKLSQAKNWVKTEEAKILKDKYQNIDINIIKKYFNII